MDEMMLIYEEEIISQDENLNEDEYRIVLNDLLDDEVIPFKNKIVKTCDSFYNFGFITYKLCLRVYVYKSDERRALELVEEYLKSDFETIEEELKEEIEKNCDVELCDYENTENVYFKGKCNFDYINVASDILSNYNYSHKGITKEYFRESLVSDFLPSNLIFSSRNTLKFCIKEREILVSEITCDGNNREWSGVFIRKYIDKIIPKWVLINHSLLLDNKDITLIDDNIKKEFERSFFNVFNSDLSFDFMKALLEIEKKYDIFLTISIENSKLNIFIHYYYIMDDSTKIDLELFKKSLKSNIKKVEDIVCDVENAIINYLE